MEDIATLRKQHFSFNFQYTNLMENFSAYENVCLSRMIQDQVPLHLAAQEVKPLMDEVRLPKKEVTPETLAVNLSGGQRQRLAFVRALNTHFSVIFGDEPTGNLDEKNANDLMDILRENISEKQAAIIVSHDIDLAIEHADRIVVITKDPKKGYGEIHPQNIFERHKWKNYSQDELGEFRQTLQSFYDLDTEDSSLPK